MKPQQPQPALPFFLDCAAGQRFCLFHRPQPDRPARGAILYVHPFAEELNTTRRMAALQARAFAALGYGVLQIDLYGCGDSSGEFADARWPIWLADLATASRWLMQHVDGPLQLWGVRLGGLLALDFARAAPQPVDGIILWHPYLSGATCINQFLRMHMAAQLHDELQPLRGSAALRAQLADERAVEVAGYTLAPALVREIDAQQAARVALPACRIDWFANPAPAASKLGAAVLQLQTSWRATGVSARLHTVNGRAFWAGAEVGECPAMLASCAGVFR